MSFIFCYINQFVKRAIFINNTNVKTKFLNFARERRCRFSAFLLLLAFLDIFKRSNSVRKILNCSMNFRLPNVLKEKIEAYAEEQNKHSSAVVREAVCAYVKGRNQVAQNASGNGSEIDES